MSTIVLLLLALVLTVVFIFEMRHSLKRSTIINNLIQKKEQSIDSAGTKDEILEEIYHYCMADWKLRRVMKKYDAGKSDIRLLHDKLMEWGDFKKGRRYVPISSFFYVYTLDYLLCHKDADSKKLAMKCMNFFHI